MRLYTEGYVLEDNEYLLKIREKNIKDLYPTGFLTKLNKPGTVPQKFINWGYSVITYNPLTTTQRPEIQIHTESFKSGWKIFSARYGESQNWAVLVHPDGFLLEIYMNTLIEILMTSTVINGELIGNYKWSNKILIKQEMFDTESTKAAFNFITSIID